MSRSPHPMRVAGSALALGLLVAVAPLARGQSAPPLGRYVPADDLALYVEFDGLDAHADAWKKTAPARLLDGTAAGAAIKGLVAEAARRAFAEPAGGRPSPAGAVVELLRRSVGKGFLIAVNAGGESTPMPLVVVRGGAKDGTREAFERRLADAGLSPKDETFGKRTLRVAGDDVTRSGWWSEGDDLVVVLVAQFHAVSVGEAIDGARPNATTHPRVVALRRAEPGFEPVVRGFIDFASRPLAEPAREDFRGLPLHRIDVGLGGLKRIEGLWGFDGPALRGELRVVAPAPRRGLLAVFDGPGFARGEGLSIPPGRSSFVVASARPRAVSEGILAAYTAGWRDGLRFLDVVDESLRVRSGVRVGDLIGRLGPRMVVTGSFEGSGLARWPRVTGWVEAGEPEAFLAAIRRLVDRLGPGGASIRNIEAPHPGLTVDPPSARRLPGPMAPTLRIGRDRVVIAATLEGAADVLAEEERGVPWSPDPAIAPVLASLPERLVLLSVSDPADAAPPFFDLMLPGLASAGPMLLGGRMLGTSARAVAPAAPAPIAGAPDLRALLGADESRRLLFPGLTAVSTDDEGIRLVSRVALPGLSAPESTLAIAVMLPLAAIARGHASEAGCKLNFMQIGLAFHNHDSVNGGFPAAAIVGKDGKPLLSWRVAILPYIEQVTLYDEFHLDEPWDSPHNRALIPRMPATYRCPDRPDLGAGLTTYRAFVGDHAAIEPAKIAPIARMKDGPGRTLVAVESADPVPWTKPDDLPFDPAAPPAPRGVGGPHWGAFHALLGDGSAAILGDGIDPKLLRALITIDGGEKVDPPR